MHRPLAKYEERFAKKRIFWLAPGGHAAVSGKNLTQKVIYGRPLVNAFAVGEINFYIGLLQSSEVGIF